MKDAGEIAGKNYVLLLVYNHFVAIVTHAGALK
jgi:hypothetical protein